MGYLKQQDPVDPVPLDVGDKVRLDGETRTDWWWEVRAVSEHFAVCVHQAEFQPMGTIVYTVLDWRNGVRGPCNLLGQGYGDGSYDQENCRLMLADFEYGRELHEQDEDEPPYRISIEVSHRNRVPLKVLDVQHSVEEPCDTRSPSAEGADTPRSPTPST